MTNEDILKLAQDAGIVVIGEAVWRLCELVAAAEREACAEIVERNADACVQGSIAEMVLRSNAAAIRARGQA